MGLAEQLRLWGDELRAVSAVGLSWSKDDPYDTERYEHVRKVGAELFAAADLRTAEEIERSVFKELTHIAPLPGTDAAIVRAGKIFLIRRSDDGLWAMPGGVNEMGETPAQTAEREAREEAGLAIRASELVGVWDSRFCDTVSSLQLYQFVFLCEIVGDSVVPTTPNEVTDTGWFDRTTLPPLSPGHTVRVPAVFDYLELRRSFFDASA